jgi:hypothetical protein
MAAPTSTQDPTPPSSRRTPPPHSPKGYGSSTSKSGAVSTGRDASDAAAGTNATAVYGTADAGSGSLATGTYASSGADSLAYSWNGSAHASSSAASLGATSASTATNATARSNDGRKTAHSSSSSLAGTARSGLFGFSLLPALPHFAPFQPFKGGAALSILTGAFVKSVGLKALLPAVPKIHPGFASDEPIFEQAVAPTNQTAAPPCEVNCTQDANNGTGSNTSATFDALSGIFGDLMDKNKRFLAKNTPPPPPGAYDGNLAGPPAPPAKKSARVQIPIIKHRSSPSPSPSPRPGAKKPVAAPPQQAAGR